MPVSFHFVIKIMNHDQALDRCLVRGAEVGYGFKYLCPVMEDN